MSDKALTRAALELTQKIQLHFPSDINPAIVSAWNGVPVHILVDQIRTAFGRAPNAEKQIETLGTVIVSVNNEKFFAKEKFIRDIESEDRVKIALIENSFTRWFLSGEGKIEGSTGKRAFLYGKLNVDLADTRIVEALGGKEKSETTLAEMFALMEKQPNGEDGALLNKGDLNIFYILSQDNSVLLSVRLFWYTGGWGLTASPFHSIGIKVKKWHSGNRVFAPCN